MAGTVAGTLLGLGARTVSMDPRSCHLIVAVSAVLTLVMGARFVRTSKVFPAGIVAAISLIALVRYGSRMV